MPAGITVLFELLKHHESGKLRLLGTSGSTRSPVAADVPTFKALGFADIEGNGWQAFHTTAGTPRPMIDPLSAAIASEDTARWAPVVKASGFRAEE